MSKITQEFINNLGSLYENIHSKDQDFLNEESEYYDKESYELAEDMILSIALSMFSEGYTVETFIKFLAYADEEVILEKYLNSDISFISEEAVYTSFVEEQFELLEAGGILGLLARGAGAIAKGARAGASVAKATAKASKGAVKTGIEKAATIGVEKRVGKQLARSTDLSRTQKALEKVARNKATKAGVTAPQGALNPRQSTDLIKQARVAQATKGVKDTAKLALAGGVGVLGGYGGAKLAGSGSGTQGAPKTSPSEAPSLKAKQDYATSKGKYYSSSDGKTYANYNDALAARNSRRGTPGLAPGRAPSSPTTPGGTASTSKPTPSASAKPKDKKWTFQGKQVTDTEVNKKYDELRKKDPEAAADYGRNVWSQKYGQPTQGPSGAKIDPKQVEDSIKAEQEKMKKKAQETKSSTTSESYDAYDLVLEYLIDTKQVETIEEAHYVMLEMDSSAIGSIIEAKYGTEKGRKKLAKKVRAGKDVGEKGSGFEDIVKKESPKYGKKRATKIAAAAMWKNLGK
jgi:hypothetical protein